MATNPLYFQLNQQLKSNEIGANASELHGFITGLLSGGNHDNSWQTLVFDMFNDGERFPESLLSVTEQAYQVTKQQLDDDDFELSLLLNEEELFAKIDDLVNWVNHFLLGLGLAQPQLSKVRGDVGEAIYDLRQITKLGYDEEEDPEELAFALEEIQEYVRMTAILCHDEFSKSDVKPTLH